MSRYQSYHHPMPKSQGHTVGSAVQVQSQPKFDMGKSLMESGVTGMLYLGGDQFFGKKVVSKGMKPAAMVGLQSMAADYSSEYVYSLFEKQVPVDRQIGMPLASALTMEGINMLTKQDRNSIVTRFLLQAGASSVAQMYARPMIERMK